MCRFAHSIEELRPRLACPINTIKPHKSSELPPHESHLPKSKFTIPSIPYGLCEFENTEGHSYKKMNSFFVAPEMEPLQRAVEKGTLASWKEIYRPLASNMSVSTKDEPSVAYENSNKSLLYTIGSSLSFENIAEKKE
jgi:hypothetical protein